MAEFRKILDIYQGYNFKKDKQTAVGFVTSMKLAGKELKADTACKNPLNPTEDLKAVGVLSDVLWETGVTDALYLSGQMSVENKQLVLEMLYTTMVDIEVELKFAVFDYDPKQKTYYVCFDGSDSIKKGLLEKKGDDLNFNVSEDASTQVQSPLNYAFQTGIKPMPEAQALKLAVGKDKNFTKAWGLKVA